MATQEEEEGKKEPLLYTKSISATLLPTISASVTNQPDAQPRSHLQSGTGHCSVTAPHHKTSTLAKHVHIKWGCVCVC